VYKGGGRKKFFVISANKNPKGKPDLILKHDVLGSGYDTKQMAERLRKVTAIIKRKMKDKTVVVHCSEAKNRSPSVVLGYLIIARRLKFDTALKYLKAAGHPPVKPKGSFLRALVSLGGDRKDEPEEESKQAKPRLNPVQKKKKKTPKKSSAKPVKTVSKPAKKAPAKNPKHALADLIISQWGRSARIRSAGSAVLEKLKKKSEDLNDLDNYAGWRFERDPEHDLSNLATVYDSRLGLNAPAITSFRVPATALVAKQRNMATAHLKGWLRGIRQKLNRESRSVVAVRSTEKDNRRKNIDKTKQTGLCRDMIAASVLVKRELLDKEPKLRATDEMYRKLVKRLAKGRTVSK